MGKLQNCNAVCFLSVTGKTSVCSIKDSLWCFVLLPKSKVCNKLGNWAYLSVCILNFVGLNRLHDEKHLGGEGGVIIRGAHWSSRSSFLRHVRGRPLVPASWTWHENMRVWYTMLDKAQQLSSGTLLSAFLLSTSVAHSCTVHVHWLHGGWNMCVWQKQYLRCCMQPSCKASMKGTKPTSWPGLYYIYYIVM